MLSVSCGNATATLHLSNKVKLSSYINDYRSVTFFVVVNSVKRY